jgi:hypothetical protein
MVVAGEGQVPHEYRRKFEMNEVNYVRVTLR